MAEQTTVNSQVENTDESQVDKTNDANSQAESSKPENDELSSVRKEAANYRKKLRDAEAKLQEFENARLSESEKLTKRLAELEDAVKSKDAQIRQRTIESMASKHNAVDPEVVAKLIDVNSDDPADIEIAIKDVLKNRPYLVKTENSVSSGNAVTPAKSKTTPTVFTREQLSDGAFYDAHRAEILKAMAEGRIR